MAVRLLQCARLWGSPLFFVFSMKPAEYILPEEPTWSFCEPVVAYSAQTQREFAQLDLFASIANRPRELNEIRVVELFAGVGGFRIGLERASKRFQTVWSNQWEPSTRRQDASLIYQARFGLEGHSNEDIATVPTKAIPSAELLVAGFPCQDYSVATSLKRSGGIEGKKGVLWWQIHRILRESSHRPQCLFFENVDRLLKSPVTQRGRDFALILASLADLGYTVEWRVINAAEYGMPQRRRRTYILAYHEGSAWERAIRQTKDPLAWVLRQGVFAKAFACERAEKGKSRTFALEGDLVAISDAFNRGGRQSLFENAGIVVGRRVTTVSVSPVYDGAQITLGQILEPEARVPDAFFVEGEALAAWKYFKGAKSEDRVTPEGFVYRYTEGGMAFPDALDKPSRTIITGEGGAAPSRFKHIIQTPSGRYRRLTPLELERLNMFPDNHTLGASDVRRAFLMGNALVTGVVERVGRILEKRL